MREIKGIDKNKLESLRKVFIKNFKEEEQQLVDIYLGYELIKNIIDQADISIREQIYLDLQKELTIEEKGFFDKWENEEDD